MSEAAFNIGTVIADAKKVITNPIGFYREMPTEGGLTNPLIFVLVMGAVTGLLVSVFSIIGLGMPSAIAGGMALGAIIMMPIMMVIGSFIAAAIMFVIWKLMGSDKNYETAYRCIAYSMAIAPIVVLLSIIPYLATIFRAIWGCFLLYAASTEVHGVKAQTAKIVFGIFAAMSLLVGVSSEHTLRNWQNSMEKAVSNSNLPGAFKDLENIQDMSAEEAGKQMGKFLKGLEKISQGLEESTKEQPTQ